MNARVAIAMVATVLCVCCKPTRKPISRADYGPAWPFTVESGALKCQREGGGSPRLFVTLNTGDGISYGPNGSARSFGFPDHVSILLPGKTGADVQPFITLGLELCE